MVKLMRHFLTKLNLPGVVLDQSAPRLILNTAYSKYSQEGSIA